MFVGHYGAALALKAADRRVSLGLLFLAVQFVDLLFFPFVITGIERMTLIPGFAEASHYSLDYMPFTHSLVAGLAWSAFVFAGAWLWLGRDSTFNRRGIAALVLAAAVFSHWLLDLVSHTPDLPLAGDDTMKLGLGLWNSVTLTLLAEAALVLGGLWIYMRATRPAGDSTASKMARFGAPAFVGFLIVLNVVHLYGPPPESLTQAFVMAMVSYAILALIAFRVDRARMRD